MNSSDVLVFIHYSASPLSWIRILAVTNDTCFPRSPHRAMQNTNLRYRYPLTSAARGNISSYQWSNSFNIVPPRSNHLELSGQLLNNGAPSVPPLRSIIRSDSMRPLTGILFTEADKIKEAIRHPIEEHVLISTNCSYCNGRTLRNQGQPEVDSARVV